MRLMPVRILLTLVILYAACGTGRESTRHPAGEDVEIDGRMELREPKRLEVSAPLLGVATLRPNAEKGGSLVVEVSVGLRRERLYRRDQYDDILIGYHSTNSCRSDFQILDPRTHEWIRVPGSCPMSVCAMTPTDHRVSLVREGLDPRHFVSARGEIKLRFMAGAPHQVELVRLNPDYEPIYVDARSECGELESFGGLTFDGSAFWTSSGRADRIYRISSAGEVLDEVASPGRYPQGFAFGGGSLWHSDGADLIYRLGPDGRSIGSFTVPLDCPCALTFADDRLWMLSAQGRSPRVHAVDTAASLQSGRAVITDSVVVGVSSEYSTQRGLAWDGRHLIISARFGGGGEVIRQTTDGRVVQRITHPTRFRWEMAWAEGRLWGLEGNSLAGYALPPVPVGEPKLAAAPPSKPAPSTPRPSEHSKVGADEKAPGYP